MLVAGFGRRCHGIELVLDIAGVVDEDV